MTTKGETRGHCQRCGRTHVVLPDGKLAQHGYTVPNGYFKGACQGSYQAPLQVSRVITDAIIVAMTDLANINQVSAERLRSGADLPAQAWQLTAWGAREYNYEGVGRASKQVPIMKPWFDATDAERASQLELEVGESESNARFFRSHAKSMTDLAAQIHGTQLIDRDAEELAIKAVRAAKKAPIAGAYRTKGAQKLALEGLNRSYERIAREIKDRYLNEPNREHNDKGEEMYYAIPWQLNHWRTKHSLLVLELYPDMSKQVNAIEVLVINREEIKARPVIK